MPLTVLAAGGCYKWVQLHDAVNTRDRLLTSLSEIHTLSNITVCNVENVTSATIYVANF